MAGKRDIEAGRAFVRLFMKDDMTKALQGALKNVGLAAQSAGKHLMAIGAGITGPLLGAAGLFAKIGSDIADMAARTGVSTNALSEFGHAASMTGASLTDVEAGIRKMQKTLVDATDGSKSASAALEKLHLTAAELRVLSPEEQFKLIAERLAAIPDPAERAAVALEIFGKSGVKLLPAILNLRSLVKEAQSLGVSVTPEMAAAADALGDAWDRIQGAARGAAMQIGAALAPMLTDLADRVLQAQARVTAFIKENQELVVALFNFGAAVTVVGGTLVAFGKSVAAMSTALGVLLSPIGLVAAGVAAAGAAVIHFGVGWDKALVFAKGFFQNVKGFFANFQENMAILGTWLKENWRSIFADLGQLVITLGKNWVHNFKTVLFTWARVAGAIFRRVFTVDFLKFIIEGIGKALPILLEFAGKAAALITDVLSGKLVVREGAKLIGTFMDQMEKDAGIGAKETLGEELKRIIGEGLSDLRIFQGFTPGTKGPSLNLKPPSDEAVEDNTRALDDLEDRQRQMLESMRESVRNGSVAMPATVIPRTTAGSPVGSIAGGTMPFGPTFSAAAAEAAGFRGVGRQQKSLDEISRHARSTVELLKSIFTEIARVASGLIYG